MKKRFNYIDIAKGMVILLVVLGHSYSSINKLVTWLGAFHMPFFFIVTGLLYGLKNSGGKELKFSFRAKARILLVPYLIWGTIYQVFISVLAIIGDAPAFETIKMRLILIITLQSGVMWFLPAMFIALLLFLNTLKNRTINICTCLITLIVSICIPHSSDFIEAFLRPLPAVFFIGVGYYGYKLFHGKAPLPVVILSFAWTVLFVFVEGNIGMSTRTFGGMPLLAIVKGIVGTYTMLQIAMLIESSGINTVWLKAWGKNSIIVMCLHPFIIQVIRLVDHFVFGDIMFSWGVAEGIVIMSLSVAIITIFLPIIVKHLGWTFGYEAKEHTLLKA